jgi:hypothetical protein
MLSAGCDKGIPGVSKDEAYSLHELFTLPSEVHETSGVIIWDTLMWTFNDSGNPAELYGISLQSGLIVRKIEIPDAENSDWEDIAQDDRYIYIGDFGNNYGDRTNLAIYRIAKSAIQDTSSSNITAQTIFFRYADQEDFEPALYDTGYDCEAMFIHNDSIYVMTKNWLTQTSTVYAFPASPGNYIVSGKEQVESEGLITGADYDAESKQLLVCGYDNYIPFIALYDLSAINGIRLAPTFRIELTGHAGFQIEAITFYGSKILLTNEQSAIATQTVWLTDWSME